MTSFPGVHYCASPWHRVADPPGPHGRVGHGLCAASTWEARPQRLHPGTGSGHPGTGDGPMLGVGLSWVGTWHELTSVGNLGVWIRQLKVTASPDKSESHEICSDPDLWFQQGFLSNYTLWYMCVETGEFDHYDHCRPLSAKISKHY